MAFPGPDRLARHRPEREDPKELVQLHPARPPGRLSIPGAQSPGTRTVHHLVRWSRGGADRRELAAETKVRLGLALLPRCRAVLAPGGHTSRSDALSAG